MTTAQQVIHRFKRSRAASRRLDWWRNDECRRHKVVPDVMAHTTKLVDKLRPADVLAVCQRIAADPAEHALGDIKRSVVDHVPSIRDWFPSFAYTHVLHIVMEAKGELLTFNEWTHDVEFQTRMWPEIRHMVATTAAKDGVDEQLVKDAVRWRVGNAYYAFLKEQYVVALMREAGLPVKQHPLADALFRVDCWVGETNIDLYVTNPRFRSDRQGSGRKIRSGELLSDAIPPFQNQVLECEIQHTYGDVHLPGEESVKRACRPLLDAL